MTSSKKIESEAGAGCAHFFSKTARKPAEVICHNDFAPYNFVFRDRQLVGVILVVLGGDRHQRLVGRERVRVMHADLVSRRRLRDAAGPGRNRAIGVAGAFRTHGRQRCSADTELGGLVGTDLGQRAVGHQCRGNQCRESCFAHYGHGRPPQNE